MVSVEEQLQTYLNFLNPEIDILTRPNDETLTIYMELWELFAGSKTNSSPVRFEEVETALKKLDALSKLRKCAARDARRSHRERTNICDAAVKILSWVMHRKGNLSKEEKEDGVDVLMEIFFSCEKVGGKTLVSTAQLCVWGLQSFAGKFPHEGGRMRRVLEVARASNLGNVFQSEKIHFESCRLLKSLMLNNGDSLGTHICDWILPIIRSLAHKTEKIREVALSTAYAGLSSSWDHLDLISQKLMEENGKIWQMIIEFMEGSLQEPVGSKRRIHTAKLIGSLNVKNDQGIPKLNLIMGYVKGFFNDACPERIPMLISWRFVMETITSQQNLSQCLAILLKPLKQIFKDGREPDSLVRREAFITWTYLSEIVFEQKDGLSHAEGFFSILHRVLGDYDVQVRGAAVTFSAILIRAIQQEEGGEDDQEDGFKLRKRKQRRSKILDSTPLEPSGFITKISSQQIVEILTATLKTYPEISSAQNNELIAVTSPIYVSTLTVARKTSGVITATRLAGGTPSPHYSPSSSLIANHALESLEKMEIEQVASILNDLSIANNSSERILAIPPLKIANLVFNFTKQMSWKEFQVRLTSNEKKMNLILSSLLELGGGPYRFGVDIFWHLDSPIDCWISVMKYFSFIQLLDDVVLSLWLGFIFINPQVWPQNDIHYLNEISSIWTRNFELVFVTDTSKIEFVLFCLNKIISSCLSWLSVKACIYFCKIVAVSDLRALAKLIGDIIFDLEKANNEFVHEFIECALILLERIIEKGDMEQFTEVLPFLFRPSSDAVIKKCFPFLLQSHCLEKDFDPIKYKLIIMSALECTDKGIQASAIEFWNANYVISHDIVIPTDLAAVLQRAAREFSFVKGYNTPTKKKIREKEQEEEEVEKVSSSTKRGRISDKVERNPVGVTMYTNLDPSQIQSFTSSSPESPSRKPSTDLKSLINEIQTLTKQLDKADVSSCTDSEILSLFKKAGEQLIESLWNASFRKN